MKRDYPDRPFVAVGVVVFRDDSVLLIKRGKPPKLGQWSIPGGGQDVGETLPETAAREVLEETGISFANLQLVDALDLIDRDDKGHVRHHYTLIDYTADYAGGELCPGDDAADARWVPLAELDRYNLWDDTTDIIEKAKRIAGQ
ncbi:NUDIX hydrolase [Emcibacter nanhaiensis]|uniref:NUDIX domain-containing protein n=1 Tax=Emcibacter nanhaiensis TaxID=1505037 RepID=A0A501PC10_9PROT|nr:NUDIX hydrolase [Emcibacter nanhaiensis]TPD57516.1 NUDIX domain-containing protein [Emcibacter nanhaiensis]